MNRTSIVALASSLSMACAHSSSDRQLSPGERVVLETVSFDAPGEGWTIVDVAEPGRRVVNLYRVLPGGSWDRRAWVEEHAVSAAAVTPERFLAEGRALLPVTDARQLVTPRPEEAMRLDDRFGPLSVSGTVRMEPKPGHEEDMVRGAFHVQEWRLPSRPDRFFRAAWVERATGPVAAVEGADPPWGAFMDSLRSPPPTDAVRTAPDVEHTRSLGKPGWMEIAPLTGIAGLRGERVSGGGLRVSPGAGVLFPRARAMKGFQIDLNLFIGNDDEWEATVTTVSATWWRGRGRLRWGAGPEVGVAFLEDRTDDFPPNIISGFVVGLRGGVHVDLVRGGSGGALFVGVDAGAATPRLYRAEALLGVRLGSRRW